MDITLLSNEELQGWMKIAEQDLLEVSEKDFNSEWHETCFCALAVLCQEKNRRTSRV